MATRRYSDGNWIRVWMTSSEKSEISSGNVEYDEIHDGAPGIDFNRQFAFIAMVPNNS
jgi:hypothetical protein